MTDVQTLAFSLSANETRQYLLESGSTVLVLTGRLCWREPPGWLAESVVASEHELAAEEARVAGQSGWVEFAARSPVEAVIIPPRHVAFWSRAGATLNRLFGQSGQPNAPAAQRLSRR